MWIFLLLALVAARPRPDMPRLKPGKSAFSSTVTRSRVNGKSRVSLGLSATERVVLDLEPHDDLFAPDYQEFGVSTRGERTALRQRADIPNCWFKGKVVGDPLSSVLVSDCPHGFQSIIQRGNGRIRVAQTSGEDTAEVSVFDPDDEEQEPGGCGVSSHSHDDEADSHGEEQHGGPSPVGQEVANGESLQGGPGGVNGANRRLLGPRFRIALPWGVGGTPQDGVQRDMQEEVRGFEIPGGALPPDGVKQEDAHGEAIPGPPPADGDRQEDAHGEAIPGGPPADGDRQPDVEGELPQGGPAPNRRLLIQDSNVSVIEIALVSDYLYVKANSGPFGRDLSSVAARNIDIMTFVNLIYKAPPFAKPTSFRIKAQYFFTAGDPYQVTVNGNGEVDESVMLVTFRDWANNLTVPYDLVHLLTNYDFSANTIGFAYVGAACGVSKVGMSMASLSLLQVVNTVAHEIGHNLGMQHDSSPCDSTTYMMAPIISCGIVGLCNISSCSVNYKDTYALRADAACLSEWIEPTCSDGLWNGNETEVDCGGNCPPCNPLGGCGVNNGGCADVCTPMGVSDYVCGCSDPNQYVDTDGVSCVDDIDQCESAPCDETCVNTVGPGNSFKCSCTSPKELSLFDFRSCSLPTCFDRRRNQGETMIDCGGPCARSCACMVVTADVSYDGRWSLNQSKLKMWGESPSQYIITRYGVAQVRVFERYASGWQYARTPRNGVWGYVSGSAAIASTTPFSGRWSIWTGYASVNGTLGFATCAPFVPATCGNGIEDEGEECDSCLVFSGGVCVTPNPCCDASCLAYKRRGTMCTLQGFPGSCWDGQCVTRGTAIKMLTEVWCFGGAPTCPTFYSAGEICPDVKPDIGPFTDSTCSEPLVGYTATCMRQSLTTPTPYSQVRGFPCSQPNADGVYPRVCSGGTYGDGAYSSCVDIDSLTDYTTLAPVTSQPTSPTRWPTSRPTRSPTLPTFAPTTKTPTTMSPTTLSPTSSSPTTNSPTTTSPTTISPTTISPTTLSPTTSSPTTSAPATLSPSNSPTTSSPSRSPTPPTTSTPSTGAPTGTPTAPTAVPTTAPTAAPTGKTKPAVLNAGSSVAPLFTTLCLYTLFGFGLCL